MQPRALKRIRNGIVLMLAVYFVAGSISQKMLPGVDEIFPFFGWSLFSRVPNTATRYEVIVSRHNRQDVDPPEPYLKARLELVKGSRHLGRKVIQLLGTALEEGDRKRADELQRLFEGSYLAGHDVRYEVVWESYDPLEKWRTGKSLERRSIAVLVKGARP